MAGVYRNQKGEWHEEGQNKITELSLEDFIIPKHRHCVSFLGYSLSYWTVASPHTLHLDLYLHSTKVSTMKPAPYRVVLRVAIACELCFNLPGFSLNSGFRSSQCIDVVS